ncbi:bifunctional nicotinamide mononucleotide adenylyltransferase/ADP-ribose pyrophosphatase [Corynebacterium freiburgense]|nr:bifunctional nicotinamide mononucleotide adenylyltransferase/ADP-ribose pyrophosphatase [Corynebacterium freiburgense]
MHKEMNYQPPTLTVDLVAFQLENNELTVLLLRRVAAPFQGELALPGGYNWKGEATQNALARIAQDKIGLNIHTELGFFEQLYTFDTVARDPRGHAVSVVYLGCGANIHLTEGSHKGAFYPVSALPQLAFDHNEIVHYAHQRLKNKITYSNAISGLLPQEFTLSQLQAAYQAVLGRNIDKRNFRKKILSLHAIEETGNQWREGAHRPAKLYRFQNPEFEEFAAPF